MCIVPCIVASCTDDSVKPSCCQTLQLAPHRNIGIKALNTGLASLVLFAEVSYATPIAFHCTLPSLKQRLKHKLPFNAVRRHAGAKVRRQDLQPVVQKATVPFFEALLMDVPFLVKATLIAMIACLYASIILTWNSVTEETIFYAVLFSLPATSLLSNPISHSLLKTNCLRLYHVIASSSSGSLHQKGAAKTNTLTRLT